MIPSITQILLLLLLLLLFVVVVVVVCVCVWGGGGGGGSIKALFFYRLRVVTAAAFVWQSMVTSRQWNINRTREESWR